ncbi:MAG: RnfABCDGE type electron transport complex subunit G [bacterium]
MKEMLKLGVFLMVVCTLATLGLALTNQQTAPLIAEQKRVEREAALKEVLPDAATFEETKGQGKTYYLGRDESGKAVGAAFEVRPKGYGGEIVIMVGVDTERRVTGIKILEIAETPGLGAKAGAAAFTEQFKGKTAAQVWLKDKDEQKGEIDAITAATITSKAVTKGVREGVEEIQNVLP